MKNFTTREERHYCACLFASLKYSEGAVKHFFNAQENATFALEDSDFDKVKIYYEFTALREYLFLLKTEDKDAYALEKKEFEKNVFGSCDNGDIQKKKPDLAFYFKKSKKLILIEAKFEGKFNIEQINQTQKYGEALQEISGKEKVGKEIFGEEISEVHTVLLGLYKHQKDLTKFKRGYISWEKIKETTTDSKLKAELKEGLDFQVKHLKRKSRKLNMGVANIETNSNTNN